MNPRLNKSITLLELIMAITLISLIVLGFTSIDLYIRYNVQQADRRTKVQNALSYVLDHMTKNIAQAVGDKTNFPNNLPIIVDTANNIIKVWIDNNNNGKRDTSDIQIAYAYDSGSYQIWYYSNYPTSGSQVIAKNITSNFSNTGDTYVIYDITDPNNIKNYIDIKLVGRWKATDTASQTNPEITMRARIKMPLVSTH